jgi:UPF0716 protein FxsA
MLLPPTPRPNSKGTTVLARLLLLFIVTPLIELWLLMLVSAQMGLAATILMVLVTGTIGATLARRQGLQNLRAIQSSTQQGQIPTTALVDSVMIFAAGLLLITPGILTDIVGFSLLVPPVRTAIRHRLKGYFRVQATMHAQSFGKSVYASFSTGPTRFDDGNSPDFIRPDPVATLPPEDVIDVEFERKPSSDK